MAMTAPVSNNKKEFPREEPKTGMRVARIFRIVDIGSHWRKGFKGEEDKLTRMVRVDFELPNDILTQGDLAGKYMAVGETFTFSTSEKARLRKKVIDPLFPGLGKGGDRFDLTKLLGAECMVQLVRSQPNADGRTYINIQSVVPIPEGMPVPKEMANPQITYSLGDVETFEDLPEWLKVKIYECEEFKAQSAKTGTDDGTEIPF